VAKAGDVDASAAEAVKSGSAETAAQRSCAETANPAAEATDCTTAETATAKPAATEPAAAEPASMTTGEPTPSVTTTSSVTTTAPSVATATAATPACKGINRSKGDCSTDRGGDGNSDDCFSKHGKFPLWNDLPDRNNLVAAAEQRLNVKITIARSENGLSHHCAAEAPGYLLQRHPRSTQVEDETENVQRLVRFSKFSSAGTAATQHRTHRRRRLPAQVGVADLSSPHPACQLLQKLVAQHLKSSSIRSLDDLQAPGTARQRGSRTRQPAFSFATQLLRRVTTTVVA
jgi:hypothetical protein